MINPLARVDVLHFTLHHPSVRPEHAGMRIAQISDVHMGPWVKTHHVTEIVSFVDALSPDLLALTGDYVGYNRADIERCASALATTSTPCFAVLGNHDHWTSTERSRAAFSSHPSIRLLTNEHVTLENGVCVVGVDDSVTGHADADAAFTDIDPDAFCLTLNHVPSYAPECTSRGAHLVLSGHTHNFQFNIPRLTNRLASTLGARFFSGAYRLDDAFLYINRGLGSATWPLRIRARPELTLFTLAHAEAPSLELTASSIERFG